MTTNWAFRARVLCVCTSSFLSSIVGRPVFSMDMVPVELGHTYSLDIYQSFYLNKYIDHHACEILSI
ncbi:hypothetical protein BDN71DRAFT_1389685 [Pleurotus eryngii]|uniref:Secreted protein n=1 Tax=Pleurotus eryngii TaxID=5323 RepID=A0A9P5ZYK0_PLEER|nr:hypothetical protein BDN71DRAFT_1389685 [Pleurotus eryngii]